MTNEARTMTWMSVMRFNFHRALLVAALATCGVAVAQTTPQYSNPSNPTPATPAGWTKTQAMQWLLPNQQVAGEGQPMGFTQAISASTYQNLRFLAGRHLTCRNILGSLLKCCRAAVPDQQQAWWKQYAQTQRQSSASNQAQVVAHVQGAWTQIQGGADSFSLDQPITSDYENINGGGSGPPSNSPQSGDLQTMNDQFMANEDANVKPHLGWYCDNSDFETAVGKNLGECHYLGSFCSTDVLGVCLIKKESYCCFNSPTSRILREKLLSEGIGDMGSAKHWNCQGISLQDMAKGALTNTDTSEIIGRMEEGGYLPADIFSGNQAQVEYTGSGSAIGDPSRLIASDRTNATVGKMDPAAASSSIEAQAMSAVPTATTSTPTGPGQISFSTGYLSVTSGQPVVLTVTRNGGLGMVTVNETTTAGTAADGANYTGSNNTLYWGNGDISEKSVTIPTRAFGGTSSKSFTVTLSAPTGSATINPYATIQVDLQPSGN
ncbi:MAG: hypothetical protein BGO50_01695 [Rhodanobacter sp. 67-28]|nr:MAG: hypothetical protein BGO50_01695 [Rhodanobacter sp. 67-28]